MSGRQLLQNYTKVYIHIHNFQPLRNSHTKSLSSHIFDTHTLVGWNLAAPHMARKECVCKGLLHRWKGDLPRYSVLRHRHVSWTNRGMCKAFQAQTPEKTHKSHSPITTLYWFMNQLHSMLQWLWRNSAVRSRLRCEGEDQQLGVWSMSYCTTPKIPELASTKYT